LDEFGKTLTQTARSGAVSHRRYDPNGNLVAYRDFAGGHYEYRYASWNHRVREIDPEGHAVEVRFTTSERLASVVDPGGTEQRYRYNLLGGVAAIYRHSQLLESYEYDLAGNMLMKRDAAGAPLLTFEIAPGNQIAMRQLASGDSHRFTYDRAGRFLTATSNTADVEFGYDEVGRRIRDVTNGRGVEHEYSDTDQRTRILGRFSIVYAVRPDGIRITDCTGGIHRIAFVGPTVLGREYASGSSEYTRFDSSGRVCGKVAQNGLSPFRHWRREYEWSPDGDLLACDDSVAGATRWRYDRAHRLRSALLPGGTTETFAYDAAGNLLQAPGLSSVRIQEGNRLAFANGDEFGYDDRDHLVSRVGARGRETYSYDSRGFLVSVSRDGRAYWEGEYDALGRRTSKTTLDGTTQFIWNTDQLAAEIDPAGRLRVYLYTDSLALAPFMFIDYASPEADPASGTAYYVFSDHLGAPLVIEDAQRQVVWRCTYTAYGGARIDPSSRIVCNLRWPGHYFDSEIGLHYNRFRYYSPELGRYLQSDPEGISGGLNLYAYTRNPLVEVDTRGLNCGGHGKGAKAKPDCEDCRDADPALKEVMEPTEPGAIKTPEELRAETARREALLRGTPPAGGLVSGDERGPCFSMVLDQETGQAFPGINRDTPPPDLHQVLADRINNPPEGGWRNQDPPGSHSEVWALNDALNARQQRANDAAAAAGQPPPDPRSLNTDGLLIDNQRTRGANAGNPMPCCPNCTHITGGTDPSAPGYVPSQAGKDPIGRGPGPAGGAPPGGPAPDAGGGGGSAGASPPADAGSASSQPDHVSDQQVGGRDD
jgi:RHS repeat-associated protein